MGLGRDRLACAGCFAALVACSSGSSSERQLNPTASNGAGGSGDSSTSGGLGQGAGVSIAPTTDGVGGMGGSGGGDSDVIRVCGDGLVNQAFEACDDGNTVQGDGCTAECTQVEADYVCPTPGEPCVYTVSCGDGLVGGSETCDDGVRRRQRNAAGG